MADSLIGIRIILVEDHDDCREIFATMLRFHGAVVTAVANAREAIGIVTHADIVVTDFSMPGGDDGAWLLDRVNEQPRPIPVIVLSGFAESQLPGLASTRFARKLLKPIDPEQLSRAIIQVLQGTDGPGSDGGLQP
jgi:CheY-like chemotaxis protein